MNNPFSAKPKWFNSSPYSIFKATLLGLAIVVAPLCLSDSAKAIDPLRLHRKPSFNPPLGNQQTRLPSVGERAVRESESIVDLFEFGPIWFPLGPSPIPNGQTLGTVPEVPVSGRVNVIVVDPTNPNIVYVGPAQGGVFRSLDGGHTWRSLFLGAKNFAVGSMTIDPKDHDRLIVGTGEGNFAIDSHFGVGIYVIDEATSWFPHLNGPYGLDPQGNDVLGKRAITQVLVDPKDDNILFATTSSAFGGLGAQAAASAPPRGLYRSKNFRSGHPTFERLQVGLGADTRATSAVLDPGDPNHLVLSIYGLGAARGGIYYTNNALDPVPTFTLAIITDTSDQNLPLATNVKLAAARDPVSHALIVLAATSEFANTTTIDPSTGLPFQYIDQGVVRKSIDGGATFATTLPDANGFAGGQGFYNIAIAMHMTVVSEAPIIPLGAGAPQGATVSAIGISPLDDNIRLVGLETGNVFATVTGSSALADITGPLPGNYITRVVLSPTDPNVAYVAFNGYGLPAGQQVWKTTNLVSALNSGGTVHWKSAGSGIPDVSVNGLVIDPKFPDHLYAGTDLGVYASTNGGASWHRFGIGFPRVEVYDIALQSKFRILRAAIHGLGIFQARLSEGF